MKHPQTRAERRTAQQRAENRANARARRKTTDMRPWYRRRRLALITL